MSLENQLDKNIEISFHDNITTVIQRVAEINTFNIRPFFRSSKTIQLITFLRFCKIHIFYIYLQYLRQNKRFIKLKHIIKDFLV